MSYFQSFVGGVREAGRLLGAFCGDWEIVLPSCPPTEI